MHINTFTQSTKNKHAHSHKYSVQKRKVFQHGVVTTTYHLPLLQGLHHKQSVAIQSGRGSSFYCILVVFSDWLSHIFRPLCLYHATQITPYSRNYNGWRVILLFPCYFSSCLLPSWEPQSTVPRFVQSFAFTLLFFPFGIMQFHTPSPDIHMLYKNLRRISNTRNDEQINK